MVVVRHPNAQIAAEGGGGSCRLRSFAGKHGSRVHNRLVSAKFSSATPNWKSVPKTFEKMRVNYEGKLALSSQVMGAGSSWRRRVWVNGPGRAVNGSRLLEATRDLSPVVKTLPIADLPCDDNAAQSAYALCSVGGAAFSNSIVRARIC
jgi:hypothetical protein